ncbi:protein FAR1-RELATED SEQUENCE 5-like [Macadamia integrifolia]|uniref:protein FAR1-RELATED SEQUENCE 5-like n=1 Tax=Macadamia integrifolia TaxID=60698 RepID=UPI001C4F0207|nr:protein FAR1-RELATED SEQUENCE 5-like [Macadamia integrifolia]
MDDELQDWDDETEESVVNEEAGTTTGGTESPEILPYIGMRFDDLNAAYSLYNEYERKRGFIVRIHRMNYSRKRELDGLRQILSKRFVCYKKGFRNINYKNQKGNEVRHRVEVRVGCPTFIMLKAASNGWIVEKFEAKHNHLLVVSEQIFRLGSHQHLLDKVKLINGNLQKSGLGPTQINDVFVEIFNGQCNIGAFEGKLKRFMKSNERKMCTEDCQLVLANFDSIRAKEPGFIYSIKLSDNGMLSGIFWVDSRVRSSYRLFGDVVVFETTYKKNRYQWLFGPFTGVNNHRQSILFGCGLIANKTKESFEWLFRASMNAMGDKEPSAIITDECTGIVPIMSSVFPNAVHRFYLWHIAKHAQEHLGQLWYRCPEFKPEWNQFIYHTWMGEYFLKRWKAMIVKYNLKDNRWLSDKYAQKDHWVPCYLKKHFFCGDELHTTK